MEAGARTTVTVGLGDRAYPVHIGCDLLGGAATLLPLGVKDRAVFILADDNVNAVAGQLGKSLSAAGARRVELLSLAGGEAAKSFSGIEKILNWLLDTRVDRQSVLFAVGGGVIGDLGGFAAAIALRGIAVVQVPTTLLAQIDSSVGGKNGINMPQGKNLVGTFLQPSAVICDTAVLATLSPRDLRAGYAEGAKHATLGDASLFAWLEDNCAAVLAREPAPLIEFVARNCRFKAAIVEEDERESTGRRALLNLGHTFGHALESAGRYDGRLLHGEAIAIGTVLAFQVSAASGFCSAADADRVIGHFEKAGLPTSIAQITPRLDVTAETLIGLMESDKKASGGKPVFVLARGIGQAFLCYDADLAVVRRTMTASLA